MGNSNTAPTEIVTVYDVIFTPSKIKSQMNQYHDEYLLQRCFSKQEAERSKLFAHKIQNKNGIMVDIDKIIGTISIDETNEEFYK